VSVDPAAIARWLRDNQRDGRIRDPVHGEHGEYADGFAALVFGLMARREGVCGWKEPLVRALAVARRRPRESEFDQLALLLLAQQAAGCPWLGDLAPEAGEIELYRGGRLVSQNWVAMRAASATLRGRLLDDRSDREARALWDRVAGWQLPGGLFSDAPGGEASPVAYHAKFCAMLALALTDGGHPGEPLRSSLRPGLDALADLVSPAGVVAPYGRSRDTLFGAAAAVFALARGARLLGVDRFAAAARRIRERLGRFQRPDGHLPAVLNDAEEERGDWDVYVNNADYNAYAAALLLLAERGAPEGGGSDGGPDTDGVSRRPPLAVVRRGELYAVLCAEGQSVPVGTPFFSDFRYYGMQPVWIECGCRPLFSPAPYRWRPGEDRGRLADPAAAGWLPYVSVGARRYCVRRYDTVRIEETAEGVALEGVGSPEAYLAVPRWERALRSLAAGGGAPQPVFRTRPLQGVRLRRRLDVAAGGLAASAVLEGTVPAGASLAPGSRELRFDARVER